MKTAADAEIAKKIKQINEQIDRLRALARDNALLMFSSTINLVINDFESGRDKIQTEWRDFTTLDDYFFYLGDLRDLNECCKLPINALEKYKSVTQVSGEGLNMQHANKEFNEAVNKLIKCGNNRFTKKNPIGFGIGGGLIALGAFLIAAALIFAFPPAGIVAIILFIGGSTSIAAGLGTFFYRHFISKDEPMVKLGNQMEAAIGVASPLPLYHRVLIK